PIFAPDTVDNLELVATSFANVAAKVAAARAQAGVGPVTYPMNPAETTKSRPEWFHGDYTTTSALDTGLTIQETGDVAHRNPILPEDDPADPAEVPEEPTTPEEE